MKHAFFLSCTALVAAATAAGPAGAEAAYPSKPIQLVIPFPPGGATDVVGRLIGKALGETLGQPVVADNRAGAGTVIGAGYAAKAAPDGYTLLISSGTTFTVNPALPVRTPAELIAYAKANPKALSFASGNTSSLIMGEMFSRGAGIEMLRVPYTGNPAALTDVIAGRVPVMFPDISSSLAHVKSGALRAIAVVTLGERSPLAPELPTVAETVLPGFSFVGWVGLFAPAGTPAPIVAQLGEQLQKVVAMPEVAQRFEQLGAEARTMAPAEFRSFVASEVARLPKILADIGVRPQ